MTRRRHKIYRSGRYSSKKQKVFLAYFILAMGGLVLFGFLLTQAIQWVKAQWIGIVTALGVMAVGTVAYFVIKRLYKGRHRNPVIYSIQDALKIMDSIGSHYTDEDEANKELIGILKSRGLRAIWRPTYFRWGTPDGIVDGTILEGKLDLYKTEETDRLIGQLQRFCQSGKPICLVLYGRADPHHLKRIEGEVNTRYPHQVQIACLRKAKRRR